MEDKKIIVDISSSNELPFVFNRQQVQQYTRKVATQNKKAQIILTNESERIKKEYMRLCRQIKYVYGPTNGKNLDQGKEEDLGGSEKNTGNQNKLIIKDSHHSKPKMFQRIAGSTKNTNDFDVDAKISSHFQSVIEDLTKYEKFAQQNTTSNFHLGLKVCRRVREPNNFIVKRLQTDYLNVEKIKIQSKTKHIDKAKTIKEQKSDSSLNFKKKYSKTEENQDNRFANKSVLKKQQILPVIFSLSRAAQKMAYENQESQKQTPSNLINHTPSPVSKGLKPRSIRSTSNNKKPVASIKRVKPFAAPFQTYYYRDLLWKVNFSNSMIVEVPLEYQHRLRVYIGKGNNGGLIRGLVKRRIWFATTEKYQDANFVWTQIKYLPYFNLQTTELGDKKNGQKKQNMKDQIKKIDTIKQTGLLTQKQTGIFQSYFSSSINIEERSDQRFQYRNKYFSTMRQKKQACQTPKSQIQNDNLHMSNKMEEAHEPYIKTILKSVAEIKEQRMHNHLINNYIIGNKKALFKTMTLYYKKKDDYVFNYLPHTFHIEKGIQDENYFKFLRYYNQRNKESKARGEQDQCVWIVKPGQYSNRGNGIKVCKSLDEIKTIIKTKQKYLDGSQRTYIVQAYIEKPLLYNKRKFDLRHYMMITCVNGILKGYWYREGYVRTSSSEYNLSTNEGRIHLTNDAVQKNMPDYGKYEKGNKISYDELHAYLQKVYGFKNYNFKEIILPKMKSITTDIVRACSGSIDPNLHSNNFQIFGLDFMIDADFNVWLIQVNTNPCLELSCPLLANIIPKMVQNALELTLDAVYPPPVRYTPKGVHYLKKLQQQNKFDLIYDSRIDEVFHQSENAIDARLLNEEEETYEDEGQEWNQDY